MTGRIRQILAAVLLAAMLALALSAAAAQPAAGGGAPEKRRVGNPAPGTAPGTRPATRPATRPDAKTDTLDACRKLFMSGRYAAAAAGYEKLASSASLRVGAAMGLAEAQAMRGRYALAVEALKAVEAPAAGRADWHAAMAGALGAVGRYADALRHARRAHEFAPTSPEAILVRGLLLETLGRKKQAAEVYRSMEKVIEADRYRTHAPSLVALGRILDRYAILAGQKASEQAGNILNNYFQEAYQKVDKTYWPAHVAAGFFALSKHRVNMAGVEFKLAARLNKNIPAAHVGLAALALRQWQFEACMKHVAAALKINPHYPDALMLKGVCLMQWRKLGQVAPVLDAVLATNPNHLDALSLLAAMHVRRGRSASAEPFIKRVKAVNPAYAGLPNTIGQWLAAGRQFAQAEGYYQEAIRLAPELPGPTINLARVYMQTGQEDQAREYFEKAYRLDDYRADVVNFLRILRKLAGFSVKQTEHFIVKVDGRFDAVLLDQVAAEAERIWPEICRAYEHTPSARTLIEFFPTHEQFSIRITGRGWIGTVGASTGRVVVMVAPADDPRRKTFGTYNWATVLRHELTHTVTLSATKNRIPHWFTEACAVFEQPDRRGYGAVRQLVAATRSGRLLPVRELNWAFIRPRRQGDRSLAYAQAEWIMEYIIATRSFQTIPKMLRAFRDGHPQEKVFRDMLGVGEKDFDKAFGAWARKDVRRWGFEADRPPDPAAAAKRAKDKPNDAAAQAELAAAEYARRRMGPAEAAAKKALSIDADNTRALGVLARVRAVARKYDDETVAIAEKLARLEPASYVGPRVLAACHLHKRAWNKAIYWLEVLKHRQHLDPYSYTELARLYTQLGRPEKALPNLTELHRRTLKQEVYARQIAETYRLMNRPDEALGYYEKLTHIDPYETSAYEAMAGIHKNARRFEQAVAAIRNVSILKPDSGDAWAKLAMMRYLAGKAAGDAGVLRRAREEAEKARKLDPAGYGEQVIRLIDKVLGRLPATQESDKQP